MMPPGRPLDGKSRPSITEVLRERIDPQEFQNWFESKTRFEADDRQLKVFAGSSYLLKFLQKKYGEHLRCVAREFLGGEQIHFLVDAELVRARPSLPIIEAPAPAAPGRDAAPHTTAAVTPRAAARSGAPRSTSDSRKLMDLADFVTSQSNQLAWTGAQQVIAEPGVRLNPFYVFGPVGVGKSHLVEGLCREIRRLSPLNVLVMSGEDFGNQFAAALRERSTPQFRQRFRNVDVLAIDDVEFFEGKTTFQDEFLQTLKAVIGRGGQVVLTAEHHPRLLTRLSDELISRLMSGLVCRIEPPDAQMRQDLASRFAQRLQLDITTGALDLVAKRFTNNVREIEGALNSLRNWQDTNGRRIDVQAARDHLADLHRDCLRIVRISDIDAAVCDLFGVGSEDLKSGRRTRSISQPRMLAMYLARRMTHSAYSEIGHYFGGRNHSTVMAAERKVSELLQRKDSIRIANRHWTMQDVVTSLQQQLEAG